MKPSINLLFLLVISVTKTFSCTCPPHLSVKDEFSKTSLIVSGKIIDEEVITTIDSVALAKFLRTGGTTDKRFQQRIFGNYVIKYKLILSEVFKGKIEKDTISVYTPGNSCKSNFEVGKDYIIYGYENEVNGIPVKASKSNVYPNDGNLIWAQDCSRTKVFRKQEAKQLRKLSKK